MPGIEQAQSRIHFGGNGLDQPEGADKDAGKTDAAHREILDSALGLGAVERVRGDLYFSERIFFNAIVSHKKAVTGRSCRQSWKTSRAAAVGYWNQLYPLSPLICIVFF